MGDVRTDRRTNRVICRVGFTRLNQIICVRDYHTKNDDDDADDDDNDDDDDDEDDDDDDDDDLLATEDKQYSEEENRGAKGEQSPSQLASVIQHILPQQNKQ